MNGFDILFVRFKVAFYIISRTTGEYVLACKDKLYFLNYREAVLLMDAYALSRDKYRVIVRFKILYGKKAVFRPWKFEEGKLIRS
jgi:hypothetical protein